MPKTKTAKVRYKPVVSSRHFHPSVRGLRANIAVNGVLVPILVDSDGRKRGIIDGNYRKRSPTNWATIALKSYRRDWKRTRSGPWRGP